MYFWMYFLVKDGVLGGCVVGVGMLFCVDFMGDIVLGWCIG